MGADCQTWSEANGSLSDGRANGSGDLVEAKASNW